MTTDKKNYNFDASHSKQKELQKVHLLATTRPNQSIICLVFLNLLRKNKDKDKDKVHEPVYYMSFIEKEQGPTSLLNVFY